MNPLVSVLEKDNQVANVRGLNQGYRVQGVKEIMLL